ncbi:MAG: transglutaminase domain-containing protein [Bacteroidota bacterium]
MNILPQKRKDEHWFLLLVFSLTSLALSAQTDYTAIDQHARQAPKRLHQNLPALSDYLLKGANNNTEKVRSFYSWIIKNIEYDEKARESKRINRHIVDILQRRKALCLGYAQLLLRFCQEAEIPCQIIEGYTKGAPTSTPNLERPDHAWNAVFLDGRWQLLDVTWGHSLYDADGNFDGSSGRDYFLPTPQRFVLDHLPVDPAWQLLRRPIQPQEFRLSPPRMLRLLQDSSASYAFEDSLHYALSLPAPAQKLLLARRSYRFYPTEATAKELSATLMDYEYHLGQRSEALQARGSLDSLLQVQEQMVSICEEAKASWPLFPKQQENCAYNRIHYGISLKERVDQSDEGAERTALHQQMLSQFQQAQAELQQMEQNAFVRQGLRVCEEYIGYCEDWLGRK